MPTCLVAEPVSVACRGETVAVCTMEKANVAINKLAQEDRLGGLDAR